MTWLQMMLIVLFMGAADRIRGDEYHLMYSRFSEKFAYGWLIAALTGHPWDVFTAPVIVALFAGSAPGWGGAISAGLYGSDIEKNRREWWQVWILHKYTWVALTFRGFMWGVCFLPIAYFDPIFIWAFIGYTVSFPVAVFIASKIDPPRKNPLAQWEYQEYLRGWIAGIIIALSQVQS